MSSGKSAGVAEPRGPSESKLWMVNSGAHSARALILVRWLGAPVLSFHLRDASRDLQSVDWHTVGTQLT